MNMTDKIMNNEREKLKSRCTDSRAWISLRRDITVFLNQGLLSNQIVTIFRTWLGFPRWKNQPSRVGNRQNWIRGINWGQNL